MFESLSDGLQGAFKSLSGKGKLTESNMREGLELVKQSLLDADVSYSVIEEFMSHVSERALGKRVLLSLRPHEELVRIVHDELVSLLGPVDTSLHLKKDGPTIIMLCGLQGSGKTTTCGKLAQLLLEENIKPLLVAADLQRPAAIEQLHVIGRQLNVPVYSDSENKNPVQVCKAGVDKANAEDARVVILDTAGRLAIDDELMAELQRIDKRVSPDQVYLVVDGMTGQDAVQSAGAFNEALELDGVVMTKLDGDARGGALLSVKHVTGVPIKFMGTGEHFDALEPFRPDGMASRILQMGDIVAAAREAHRIVDEKEREEMEAKMASGDFTLDDFKNMMEKVAKPGLMGKMMSLMPGMNQFKEVMESEEAAGGIKQTIGAINSMTQDERKNPKLIDAARRTRIAKGAGVQTPVVSQLVKQFEMMKPVMQMMAGKGAGDRMKMMQQLQASGAMTDPRGMGAVKVSKGTGKRLSPAEKAKQRKERDKLMRRMKRKKGKR
ncbi:signal recognition particle protein [Crateriforma conspicua]|uniref:signal-recognition-particle GTPase n=1 Tax=Crateriforma conspicua TaxID=2527996 RepID=A0A5C5Y9D4_9PLAN|nr:signal recognition particle protein [Crateriforma conspicua]QDV65661.1 Signal recognition particle protein [Crateriforma conspicua]TWT71061.1 Signal recognition particle protein [Crateriforma conspicua]